MEQNLANTYSVPNSMCSGEKSVHARMRVTQVNRSRQPLTNLEPEVSRATPMFVARTQRLSPGVLRSSSRRDPVSSGRAKGSDPLDKNTGITRASLPGDACGWRGEGYRWVPSRDHAQQAASAHELLEKRGRPGWGMQCAKEPKPESG